MSSILLFVVAVTSVFITISFKNLTEQWIRSGNTCTCLCYCAHNFRCNPSPWNMHALRNFFIAHQLNWIYFFKIKAWQCDLCPCLLTSIMDSYIMGRGWLWSTRSLWKIHCSIICTSIYKTLTGFSQLDNNTVLLVLLLYAKAELGCMRLAGGRKALCWVEFGNMDEQNRIDRSRSVFCLLGDLVRRWKNDLRGRKKWTLCKISLRNKMPFKMSSWAINFLISSSVVQLWGDV